jgi:hypothetical protein
MKWKAHTSKEEFATDFKKIMDENEEDNDKRAQEIEQFLIQEAEKIGVV